MERFVIVCFLGQPPQGTFRSAEWPLHMTLVRPFNYEGPEAKLLSSLVICAQSGTQLALTASERLLFGHQEHIPVTTINPTPELQSLHYALISSLQTLGAELNSSSFNGSTEYHFHVTDQRDEMIPPGSTIQLTSFSLIDRQADGQPGLKGVIQTFQLSVG